MREHNIDLSWLLHVLIESNQLFIDFEDFRYSGAAHPGGGLGSTIDINSRILFNPLKLAAVIYKEGVHAFQHRGFDMSFGQSYTDFMLSLEMDAHKKMGNVWRKIGGYGKDRIKQELDPIDNQLDMIYDLYHGIKTDINGEYYQYNTLEGYIYLNYKKNYE